MKHHTREQLQVFAQIEPDYRPLSMSRRERLERWAELLEQSPTRHLATLYETEHQTTTVRDTLRNDGSPISVAFDDPILRAAGMEDDTYGEALRFFELRDWQLHGVICYCHFGATVNAETAARLVRSILTGERSGLFARLRALFVG
ncbi:hypothetical protein AC244_05515 [Ensifer adhaerens]|uniref:Uncharacterized protein n=1 Tax=Ensifer adhaerens TaxID=106592 RepID=A0A0L8C3A4_ENSAD|nr:hypothetical protein [Ensifer adhaerens]KOF21432.1 hypothetical protein AC244_05515 [Ensifer adhaerens]